MTLETLQAPVEAPEVAAVPSFRDRIQQAPVYTLSSAEADELGRGYFQEEKEIFERRFVALSLVIPEDVRTVWGEKAEKFAMLQDDIDRGDTRGLKHFVISAEMNVNRQAQEAGVTDKGLQKFGNALYMVGTRMQASIGER